MSKPISHPSRYCSYTDATTDCTSLCLCEQPYTGGMMRSNIEHPDTTTPSVLVTEAEAQTLLRLSRRTLVRLRQEGKLAYVSIGRTVRYRRLDIEAFCEAHRRNELPSPATGPQSA